MFFAGETVKSTSLTNRDSGKVGLARDTHGRLVSVYDTYTFGATELQAGDHLILNMPVPSNARILDVLMVSDDLDTHACAPTLVVDIGLSAGEAFSKTVSGTVTKYAKDDLLVSDILVDGDTTARAATVTWTSMTKDTMASVTKPLWSLLGYDFDPRTFFNVTWTSQAAAATAGANAMHLRVLYVVD